MENTKAIPASFPLDDAGLAQLLDTHGDRLLRMCTLYLKDPHLAEDAVQETMLRAWRKADTFRGESSTLTWLTRIAINVCKGYLRSPWKRLRAPSEELDNLTIQPASAPDDSLPRAVMALSRPYREVIILHYYQELKAREIAELLHLPLSTVTVRLSRGRDQLRNELKGWCYDV